MSAVQQRQRWPFRAVARKNYSAITTRAITAASLGADLEPIKIPEVGIMGEIIVGFRGTGTISGAMTAKARGLWALLKQITLSSNINNEIVKASGYGLAKFSSFLWPGFMADGAPAGATAPSTNYYAFAGAGAGAQTWNFALGIPVAFNMGRQFDQGVIVLAAEGVQMHLNLNLGTLADISAQLTDLTGTFYIGYQHYEMPDESVAELPPLSLTRIRERSEAVAAVGENRTPLERDGVHYNVLHYLENNATFANANVSRVGLDFNRGQLAFNQYLWENQFLNRRELGVDLPAGHWAWNMAHDEGMVNSSVLGRDTIDTRKISVPESVYFIPESGVTLTNARLFTLRRFWQQLN